MKEVVIRIQLDEGSNQVLFQSFEVNGEVQENTAAVVAFSGQQSVGLILPGNLQPYQVLQLLEQVGNAQNYLSVGTLRTVLAQLAQAKSAESGEIYLP